jgi:hypothetical protein
LRTLYFSSMFATLPDVARSSDRDRVAASAAGVAGAVRRRLQSSRAARRLAARCPRLVERQSSQSIEAMGAAQRSGLVSSTSATVSPPPAATRASHRSATPLFRGCRPTDRSRRQRTTFPTIDTWRAPAMPSTVTLAARSTTMAGALPLPTPWLSTLIQAVWLMLIGHVLIDPDGRANARQQRPRELHRRIVRPASASR